MKGEFTGTVAEFRDWFASRQRDADEAYARVTVKDCGVCIVSAPVTVVDGNVRIDSECKGHRLIVRQPMQAWVGWLR